MTSSSSSSSSSSSDFEPSSSNSNERRHDSLPAKGAEASETSPLLAGSAEQNGLPEGEGEQDDRQKTKSIWYLILLTISIGGLQLAWSVELSNGSPYLMSLGLSKSLMALVWIAGPLTGTLVQPYVGMLSDNCKISWGKRKPFMIVGAAATTLSLMFLAWTREIVGGILGLFGADLQSKGAKVAIIVFAVMMVYMLDFAINTGLSLPSLPGQPWTKGILTVGLVQAAIRAFIVDCAPSHQQEAANAMASRIVGVGNILGYCTGYINLPKYLWFLGNTQFKVLCAIASIGLCSTILLSVLVISERDPRLDGPPATKKPGVFKFFLTIFTSIKRLPPQIKKVCTVQFCAWVGFFPMLFYTSSYIGEVWIEPYLEENPHMTPQELDVLYEQATRVGTFALLIFAITSLATNVLLPFFIAPTYDHSPVASNAPFEAPGAIKDHDEDSKSFLDYLVIPGFTLRRAWMISHIIFALAMFCTVLVRTVEAATALIGLVGITWALTLWAPWAIISGEISRRDVAMRARKQNARSPIRGDNTDTIVEEELDQERSLQNEEETDQAGVILGIHNMAIAAPQMLATIGSSIIFRFTQKPRGTPGDHSFAIVLALGGFFVLGASYYVHLIKDDMSTAEVQAAVEEGDAAVVRSKRPNFNRTKSQGRATFARTTSYGTGLEY